MERVIVTVSILLLLLVGIPFVVGGLWLLYESWGEEVVPMSFASFVWGSVALLIGTPFCVGAGCLAARSKPWQPQQPPSPDIIERIPPGKHLCPNCGCREADGSKTCRWCGADQE